MADLPDSPSARAALSDHVARLKHDLGKYVSMQQRWLGPDPPEDALRDALTSDLLSTRRGPLETVDAPTVWAEFRPLLVGDEALPGGGRVDLRGDSDFEALDGAMRGVSRAVEALRTDSLDRDGLFAGHRAAMEAADACRELARRLGAWGRRMDG